MLALLVFLQNFAGALDDAARKSCEAGDFDTVTLVGAARLDASQENDLVGRLLYGDVNVLHAGQEISKLGEFVVVRGKERACACVLLQMLDHRPGDGKAVKSRCTAADLIKKNETRRRGVMQDGGNFAHLD